MVDGPGSHVEQVVAALGQLVVEQADSLVDVVGLELPHHVRTRDRAVDVRYYHLRVLLPQKYLELGLLEHPRTHLQHEPRLVLPRPQLHPLQQLVVRCLAVPDDFLFVEAGGGGQARGWLFFDVQLGDVVAAEDGEPALLVFGAHDLLDQSVGLLPEGELAGEDCCSQLPGVEAVVDAHDEVGVVDDVQRVLDELAVLDLVGVKDALQLLLAGRLLLLRQKVPAERQLEQRLLRTLLPLVRLLFYARQLPLLLPARPRLLHRLHRLALAPLAAEQPRELPEIFRSLLVLQPLQRLPLDRVREAFFAGGGSLRALII